MKTPVIAIFAALLSTTALCAETAPPRTALTAIKLLPKGESKKIARIEARDGTPAPERWYILTHDEKTENGVREYVVAGGELVASRTLSQFVESLKPDDVIGADALKVDSDKAAKLAQQYALTNNLTIATLNYELKKDGAAAAPLWTVTCLDEAGQEVGRMVVTAGKGNVVSHDGFAVEPAVAPPKEKARTQARPLVAEDDGARRSATRRQPGEEDERKSGIFQRVGGSLQKFFTGKDTISR